MDFEYLRAIGQVLILMSAVALYFTGKHITRVWIEMQTELISLRGLIQKYSCNGSEEVRTGGVLNETGAERSSGEVGGAGS